jgi:hypothetical protein
VAVTLSGKHRTRLEDTVLIKFLLVAHIAVLGYWLGSELVINSTYRYVSWASGMPFPERNRLMDHVMDVDQHVRYALVLQAGLGTILAALLGYLPGGDTLAWVAAIGMLAWLALVEVTHRRRSTTTGRQLAALDRGIRYAAIIALLGLGALAAAGETPLQAWLAWKLAAFAGVIACGLGIRFALMSFYRTWTEIAREGSSDAREGAVRRTYVQATTVLGLLWLLIAAVVALSILKP